jgi:UDP-N-acetylglucosamine 2-epimerase (non-hydrolysing)
MRVCVAFGTRPEAIKLAPVIQRLKGVPEVELRILASGQHRSLLDQVLTLFNIQPDYDFHVMEENQHLGSLTARVLCEVERHIISYQPDWMIVQGDTTTAFAAAMAAYYHRVPIAHVEAGLRTGDRFNPFPEEINRKFIGSLANLHFAPTQRARGNLICERIDPAAIHVTGNTGIDALLQIAAQTPNCNSSFSWREDQRMLLVTSHRRESFGHELSRVCEALRTLVKRNPDVCVVCAMHPNPNVRGIVERELQGISRIHLIGAPEYASFVRLMKQSFLILTDSGGIQEEAPSLGKPVLVLRSRTERVEAIEAGTAKLVGTDTEKIVDETERLLRDPLLYKCMAQASNPYGDGLASDRIVRTLLACGVQQRAIPNVAPTTVLNQPELKLQTHA